ncbi:F-box/kelch-repeat protein At3g23880-like [Papaver somniferum]|uniref:F-box/kelch-repeat protein At3g23880-like n=1 Tax=Papaver somniferum TaxID=3469 RepID=UPI000E6F5DBF|nr:F-box/kelch-repeat protein At3g23880-like [Papaver somniferum]
MEGSSTSKGDLLVRVEDLLIQIFVCLPVISLLRFKTVCKSWRAIIESSDFIHRHAINNNDSAATNKLGTFIFQYNRLGVTNRGRHRLPHFFVLSSSSGSSTTTSNDDYPWLYKDLGIPIGDMVLERERPVRMVASCHGIICFYQKLSRDIALWNPATKQFRFLPKSLPLPEGKFGRFLSDYVGFGFDTLTKDYKVLLITSFDSDYEETKKKNAVQVYYVRTNSWRWCVNIDLPTYCISRSNTAHNHGVYLNGHYLLLAFQFYATLDDDGESCIGRETVVISFDLSNETYRIIPAPTDDDVRLDIRGKDGKIVCVTHLLPDDRKCQVYLLNDDNGYSWTKLYETNMYQPHSCLGPMAISNDGLCGFLRGSDGYGLMSYNLETQEMRDIQIPNVSFSDVLVQTAHIYKESLVSICANDTTL